MVYVALDVDVLDPDDDVIMFMPEPDGPTGDEVRAILERIAGSNTRLAGFGMSAATGAESQRRSACSLRPRHRPLTPPRIRSPMAEPYEVSIDDRREKAPETDGKPHPNTCPRCGSHYRDDELDANLRVCVQCGHHFPMGARDRIAQLTDGGTFVEHDAELHSADPLNFFDLRAYTERIAAGRDADGSRRRDRRRRRPRSSGVPARSRSWTSPSWAARWGASSARRSRAPASGRPSGRRRSSP